MQLSLDEILQQLKEVIEKSQNFQIDNKCGENGAKTITIKINGGA